MSTVLCLLTAAGFPGTALMMWMNLNHFKVWLWSDCDKCLLKCLRLDLRRSLGRFKSGEHVVWVTFVTQRSVSCDIWRHRVSNWVLCPAGKPLVLHCDALSDGEEELTLVYWLVNGTFPEETSSSGRIKEVTEWVDFCRWCLINVATNRKRSEVSSFSKDAWHICRITEW